MCKWNANELRVTNFIRRGGNTMKIITRIMAATVLSMLLVTIASAQGLPKAKTPEEVGLSSERLKRISA
jgi:hypothetical protein